MENRSLLAVLLIFISAVIGGAEISLKTKASLNRQNSSQVQTFKNVPNCTSTPFYAPVCASNGVTYHNSLVFDCDNARKGGGLQILHHGSCHEGSGKLRTVSGGVHRILATSLLCCGFYRMVF